MAKSKQIVECVPNFSEGRDLEVIKQITNQIESVEGVKLLDVDPGEATNRTVVTFVGEPENVVEAAFKAVAKALQVAHAHQVLHLDIKPPPSWSASTNGSYRRASYRAGKRNNT